MKRKERTLFIVLALSLVAIYFIADLSLSTKSDREVINEKHEIPEREQITLNFITEKMSGTGLSVYTNYLDAGNDDPQIASGRDVLSESQGLLLLYFVNRNDKESFDVCLDWTMEHMLLENNLFSWVNEDGQAKHANALIDDFRLIRALLSAYDKWQDGSYLKYVNAGSEALLTYNLEDNIPVDFYDMDSGSKTKAVSIAYLDLYTMKRLCDIDSRWETPYENSYALIQNAKIKETGLYQFQYDTQNDRYIENNEISLIQSAYVILHLAEIGVYDTEGLDWIWKEFEKSGKLYAVYSSESLQPVSTVESTALYALLARAYDSAGDRQKAEALLEACEKYQIMDKSSAIYGSFGNAFNQEVYSFDNLQYLLASSVVHK